MAEKKISPKAPEKTDAGEQAAVRVTKQSLKKMTHKKMTHKKMTHKRVIGH